MLRHAIAITTVALTGFGASTLQAAGLEARVFGTLPAALTAPTASTAPATTGAPTLSAAPATAAVAAARDLGAGPSAAALSSLIERSPAFTAATQTTLWSGTRVLALGIGIEQRWQPPAWARAPEARPWDADARLLVALAWRTSDSTRLIWQPDLSETSVDASSNASPLDAKPMVLDWRRGDAMRRFVNGSLRLELDRGTAVSLKPRARQLGLALTRQW